MSTQRKAMPKDTMALWRLPFSPFFYFKIKNSPLAIRLNLGYLLRALNRTPHKAALRSDLFRTGWAD